MVFGAEAISNTRHLSGSGETRDWAEADDGEIEDRGSERMLTRQGIVHGIVSAPIAYALQENARRARLGLSREDYRAAMGELFAPFSAVAAENPYSSAASEPLSAAEIATITPEEPDDRRSLPAKGRRARPGEHGRGAGGDVGQGRAHGGGARRPVGVHPRRGQGVRTRYPRTRRSRRLPSRRRRARFRAGEVQAGRWPRWPRSISTRASRSRCSRPRSTISD